jgi:hypothetical protein
MLFEILAIVAFLTFYYFAIPVRRAHPKAPAPTRV